MMDYIVKKVFVGEANQGCAAINPIIDEIMEHIDFEIFSIADIVRRGLLTMIETKEDFKDPDTCWKFLCKREIGHNYPEFLQINDIFENRHKNVKARKDLEISLEFLKEKLSTKKKLDSFSNADLDKKINALKKTCLVNEVKLDELIG